MEAAPNSAPPDIPDWVGRARRFIPGGNAIPGGSRTRDLIEQRVLESINEAFATHGERRSRRDQRKSGADSSLADEIDRLRSLRDAGALTEEQYARAVNRLVGGREG